MKGAVADRYKYGTITIHADGTRDVYIPNTPFDRHEAPPDTKPVDKSDWTDKEIKEREVENLDRATRRARKGIRNHILNNTHTHFVTLTYDLKKYPTNEKRFNRMETVLKELRRKYGNFHYCLVPEFHEKGDSAGLIHWHGAMDLTGFDLTRATNFHTGKELVDKQGRKLFNLDYWDSTGLSTLSEIDNTRKVASYVTKYITKNIESVVGKGRKKYWSSRGEKPVKRYLSEQEALQYLENHEVAFQSELGKHINIYNS